MKFGIYGGGAVGLGLASCLLSSREPVHIFARPETVNALAAHGLERIGIFGTVTFDPSQFSCSSSLDKTDFDYILVCVKSFDTEFAAKDISNKASDSKQMLPVILCQNGWGNAEVFAQHYPKEKIFSARVITGFRKLKPNQVDITVHADSINMGSLFHKQIETLEPVAKAIDDGGIPCQVVSEIEKDLIAKLLYNCALNPLGAILNVPYGILGEKPHTRELMLQLIEEVFLVMKDRNTHWECAEDYLETFYEKLLPPTYKHESSMLQDIRAGKKTEIDAINGAVVTLGRKLKIPTPYNHMAYNMIKFLESRQPK